MYLHLQAPFFRFFFAIGSNYTNDALYVENSTARAKRVLFINYAENKYLRGSITVEKHNNDKNKTNIDKQLQISQHKNKKLLKRITEQQYLERSLLFTKR